MTLKLGPTPTRVSGRGTIPPTVHRRLSHSDHRPPAAGVRTADGTLWKGASRVVDPPAKRKANLRSWRKLRRQWRLDAMGRA